VKYSLTRAVPAAQDQQVGNDVGTGRPPVGAVREPDGGHQVTQGGDPATGLGIAGVHRVPAGDESDHAAGPGEFEALDDEVVVHGQPPARVVSRVGQLCLAERDVPHRSVEVHRRDTSVGERLRPDIRVGVQVRGDHGGDRVAFDAGHHHAVGCQADEVTRPAPWLQHVAHDESKLGERIPDQLGVAGMGVVGVPGRTAQRPVLIPRR
jgi:hypothetical protein